VTVSWIETSRSPEEREQAALAAASALFSRRIPLDIEETSRSRRTVIDPSSELIGIAARRRFSALDAITNRIDASPDGLFGQVSEKQTGTPSAQAVSLSGEREVFGLVGRPGKGGRKPSDSRAQMTKQTRELLRRLGKPCENRRVAGEVIVMRWLVDSDSDGVWVIRLSPTKQEKAQETAMEQLHEMERQKEEGLLKPPRWIVTTLNNSGGRKPHERYDLLLLREWIEEGWLRIVVYRNEKRLARHNFTLAWCAEIFESTATGIYFTELRRCVDWDSPNDRMLFGIKGLMGAEDRRVIVEQTQKALDRRYVNEGKGWPGLQQIGLVRNPLTKYMEECEAQTKMIVLAATLFASRSGIESGLKGLAREMKDKYRFELSPKQWERIFKNEGFVTGDFFFNRQGRGRVPLRHINLAHPIPRDVFQKIQDAFATNKGNTRSRPGDFVLLRGGAGQKGIPPNEKGVFCERCGMKLRAWLQGDANNTCYRHHGKVPACCRNWGGIERADIEAVIMPELWRLEEVQDFREAAVRAAAMKDVRVSAFLDKEERAELQRQMDEIDREISRLGREYRRHYLLNGKAAGTRKNHIEAYEELVAGLKEDKRSLQSQIAAADALEAIERSVPPSVNKDLAEALREVLTIDVPDDDDACRRRAAVYGRLVTKVIVGKRDDGSFTVEIYGPLVPRDLPILQVPAPSKIVAEQLCAHLDAQAKEGGGVVARRFADARPDLAGRPELQVTSQGAPYDATCNHRYAWRIRSAT